MITITKTRTKRERYVMKRPPRNLQDTVYAVDLQHVIAGKARWRVLPDMVLDIVITDEGAVHYHVKGIYEDYERDFERIFRTPSLTVSYALAKVKAENGGAK